jgi:hypothetical protein
MTDAILGELHDVLNGLYLPQRLWQGSIRTPLFAEALLVQFAGTDDIGLTPPLQQCLEGFLEHQEHNKQLALNALHSYYQSEVRPQWQNNDFFGVPDVAPDVQDGLGFERLLSSPRLTLHSAISWGLEFECTWDVEHGAAVLFSGDRIVNVGMAEVAALVF